jgi:hypothetical protein
MFLKSKHMNKQTKPRFSHADLVVIVFLANKHVKEQNIREQLISCPQQVKEQAVLGEIMAGK